MAYSQNECILELSEQVATARYWKFSPPPKFEQHYILSNYKLRTNHFRITLYLGIFLLALYGLAEFFNLKAGESRSLFIRYGIVIPAALVAIRFFDKEKFAFLQDWLISFSSIFICFFIFVNRYEAYEAGQVYYYYGYIITVCYINIVVQPRFFPSLIASLLVWFGGILFYSQLEMETNRLIFIIFDSSFLIFLSLLANYYIQLNLRKLFAKNLLQENIQKSEEKYKRELFKMSNVDSLTGLKNRRYFDTTKSLYDKPTTGVLFIDIDYFKLFNDNYGHLIGDQCIKKVAQAIADNVRQGDLLARYGGEEFVILMDKTNPEVIRRVAQRIIEQVEELNIEHQASQYNKVTVSLGWCFYDEGNTLDDCLNEADQSLYQAKQSGRSQYYPH